MADFQPLEDQIRLSQERLEEAQVKTRAHIRTYASRHSLSTEEEGDLADALLGEGLKATLDPGYHPIDR